MANITAINGAPHIGFIGTISIYAQKFWNIVSVPFAAIGNFFNSHIWPVLAPAFKIVGTVVGGITAAQAAYVALGLLVLALAAYGTVSYVKRHINNHNSGTKPPPPVYLYAPPSSGHGNPPHSPGKPLRDQYASPVPVVAPPSAVPVPSAAPTPPPADTLAPGAPLAPPTAAPAPSVAPTPPPADTLAPGAPLAPPTAAPAPSATPTPPLAGTLATPAPPPPPVAPAEVRQQPPAPATPPTRRGREDIIPRWTC